MKRLVLGNLLQIPLRFRCSSAKLVPRCIIVPIPAVCQCGGSAVSSFFTSHLTLTLGAWCRDKDKWEPVSVPRAGVEAVGGRIMRRWMEKVRGRRELADSDAFLVPIVVLLEEWVGPGNVLNEKGRKWGQGEEEMYPVSPFFSSSWKRWVCVVRSGCKSWKWGESGYGEEGERRQRSEGAGKSAPFVPLCALSFRPPCYSWWYSSLQSCVYSPIEEELNCTVIYSTSDCFGVKWARKMKNSGDGDTMSAGSQGTGVKARPALHWR
ncbi:hypothetical protein R3P38DRAFT_3518305 [Favolaschia claudopus]|uniref:Uncharacterized protein n=1 Tax=Favolaschia claudopus TaxID=2862362 RepID=A0AAW0BP60_9AGAR